MDAVWTALDGAKPASRRAFMDEDEKNDKKNKFLDWLTM
jgi:hypothetical protein